MDEPALMVQPHQNELREARMKELTDLMVWMWDGSCTQMVRMAKMFEEASAWVGCSVARELRQEILDKLKRVDSLSQEMEEDGRAG